MFDIEHGSPPGPLPMNGRGGVVALIPARAGSKRVQGKNVRILGGHPMIAYTIAAALDSGVFASVIVSTDSEETAAIARHYGAEVPSLRPAALAGDLSPDIAWIEYTLDLLESMGRTPEAFSLLRPTSPFRQAETIRRAWARFSGTPGADSLRAVELCRQHPGKMWVIPPDDGRAATGVSPFMTPFMAGGTESAPFHSTPYQALPKVYAQNASLEIAWAETVRRTGTIAGTKVVPFLTQGVEGFDINDQHDWVIAEHLIRTEQAALPLVKRSPLPIDGERLGRGAL